MTSAIQPLSSQLSRGWSMDEDYSMDIPEVENLPSKRIPSGLKYKYTYSTIKQLLDLEPEEIIRLDINTIDPKLISENVILSNVIALNKTKDKKKRGSALLFLKKWTEENKTKSQRLQEWYKKLEKQQQEEEEAEGIVTEAYLRTAPKISSMSLRSEQDIELRRRLEKLKLRGGRKSMRGKKTIHNKNKKHTIKRVKKHVKKHIKKYTNKYNKISHKRTNKILIK
jgi:hypothetical protein